MSLTLIGIIAIIVLFILLFLDMPIGLALAMVGFLGICVVRGVNAGFMFLGTEYFRTASMYTFSVVPFFVGMGFLATEIKLSSQAFTAIEKFVGHKRGGLAMASAIACGVMAAICGDPGATAVTVAAVALPVMRKKGYSDVLSLGCLAAGGNLGFLIPPSLGFIFYAIITEQSIGTLFMSGILPGILLTTLFIATIWIICRLKPDLSPPSEVSSWKERMSSLRYVLPSMVLIIVVLGGIYAGYFTPTEAGAVGLIGVLILGLINRQLNWKRLVLSMSETTKLVGKIFILITGAFIFSRFITLTEIALDLSQWIGALEVSPYLILIIVLIFYIMIGFIMDIMSIILLTAPILHPVLVSSGFDPVWIACIVIITTLIGHISPPVGMVTFILSGYVTDVPISTIYKGALPFIGAMLVCLILLIVFPEIVLLIPNMMSP
jgi:tripartite ATP-independent transporter DctM subunit